MTEVTISSQDKTFCQETARRQIDDAIHAVSRPDDSSRQRLNGDNIIVRAYRTESASP